MIPNKRQQEKEVGLKPIYRMGQKKIKEIKINLKLDLHNSTIIFSQVQNQERWEIVILNFKTKTKSKNRLRMMKEINGKNNSKMINIS